MIKIQVVEKNGTPRELTFDKKVITIGRSARNDVILPRSNISKNHVSLEVSKKGNCIVTDLGSTNGTFVNGQKILKPVTVTPEDNIFISDFVIKVKYEDEDDIPEELSGVHEIIEPRPGDDLEAMTLHGENAQTVPPTDEGQQPPGSMPPAPPKSIHEFETRKIDLSNKEEELRKLAHVAAPPAPPAKPVAVKPVAAAPPNILAEIFKQIESYLTLDKQDIHSLGSGDFRKKASRVIAEVLDSFVSSENFPQNLEPRELSERLQAELLGLGPIDNYLNNPSVVEVSILPSGKVIVFTNEGAKTMPDPFISPDSKKFVLRKLVYMAGAAIQEGDPIITGNLEGGTTVKVISPPLSTDGTTVSIQKPPHLKSVNLDSLVENEILTPKMGSLFQFCLQLRKGIVIADPQCLSHKTLMPVLASMLPEWERIAVIQCGNEPIYNINADMYFKISESPEAFTLSKSGENLYTVIPSFQPTVIFIGELSSAQLLKVARLGANSKTTVIATIREPGAADSIQRLKQMVFNEYPEMDSETMSKLAAEGFGLVACYTKMMDRSEKITSISDIQIGKDGKINLKPIFHYDMKEISASGDIVGSFRSTRTIPSFIEEKRQRGAQIDTSIFQ